jgi:hypothetical protein
MPDNISNTVTGTGDTHVHDNDKSNDPGHLVEQVRGGPDSIVIVDNSHGSNLVSDVHGPDGSSVHENLGPDGHTVIQDHAGGDHVVEVVNANGVNLVTHSSDGDHSHTNTMGDGWVI